MVSVFVISLKSSHKRKSNVIRQFKKIGLKAEFFDAVDGRNVDHKLFKRYDDDLRLRVKGKSLRMGQLGCFASHFLLWEKCRQDLKPVIILEDDVLIFEEQFKYFLESIDFLGKEYECIRLFQNQSKEHRAIVVEKFEGFSIAKFTKGHMRATGYYLTPSGAAKLIKKAAIWFLPVDIYMDRFWDHQVECYGTVPACLTNDLQFESTIDYIDINAQKRTLLVKIRREIFSACEQYRKQIHNLRFRLSNSRRKLLSRLPDKIPKENT